MTTLTPRDANDVRDAVRAALANEQPLEIVGHGSKRAVGHATSTNAVLDVSALNAVVAYEPNELILTVQAGAPMADVLSLIDSKNQQFAFDPMDTSVLLGTGAQQGTVGGMIGAGLAGSRRIAAGGVRDHLLGAYAVSGFGDAFKTGGKVVKNVTGYDLCKLLAGSWGTLAVMTEVTLKVMPKPEAERTLVLRGLSEDDAGQAMRAAMNSPFEVSGAAHLTGSALRTVGGPLAEMRDGDGGLTLVRLEGIGVSVQHRAGSVSDLLKAFGAAEIVADERATEMWRAVRDVAPFAADGPRALWPVWRIVCPPAKGPSLGALLARETGGEVIYDWAGGLIWAALPPHETAQAKALRARVEAAGGHATLLRASDSVRAAADVFHPLATGVAALGDRIRKSFDPKHILNRGRMVRMAAS
jgi:glycolate oxidase FAD binding subunit